MRRGERPLQALWLGRVPYAEAWGLQRELVERRWRGECDDHLLLLEHDPVVTVGRGGADLDSRRLGVPVVSVERGGEATWHGPGQLVAYPIVRLGEGERDLHRWLRLLEEATIRQLADFGVPAGRRPPHTGVWTGGGKIASIGVAVRRWVTYHGVAVNVSCDLASFGGFRPCGLDPSLMTSIERERGGAPGLEEAAERFAHHFAMLAGFAPPRVAAASMPPAGPGAERADPPPLAPKEERA